MSTEKYIKMSINEPLILEPEDHTEEEWSTICKIFGMKEADRIVLSDYTMEAYGVSESVVSDEEWDKAIEYLKMLSNTHPLVSLGVSVWMAFSSL